MTAKPAVWSDTDPLMYAIADAVWERCNTEGSSVGDDPRNIAAVAATVARQVLGTTTDTTPPDGCPCAIGVASAQCSPRGCAPAEPAPAAPPVADRADLRNRIAQAMEREDARNWGYDHGFENRYGVDEETDSFVDAVLAVLPAPTDQAAVLREAEAKAREIVAKLWGNGTTQTQLDSAGGARAVEWELGLMASASRLADEAQQPEAADESCGRFVPDTPRAPGLCASCGDARGWHSLQAVGEQQPTPAEAEAHRTLTEFIAEVLEDDGIWMYLGADPDRAVAARRRASVTRRFPAAETRTVRKTTTYTVASTEEPQLPAPIPCTTPCIACMTDESHDPASTEEPK